MRERPLGIDHLTALDLTPSEFVRAAGAAGFASASLRNIHILGGEPAWADEPVDARALHAIADGTGLRIHAIEAVAINERLAGGIEHLRPFLADGAELQAELLYTFSDDPDPVRCAETFARVAELAREYGLRTLLEPMPYRAVATLDQAARIVSGVQGAGVIVDTLHASRAGTPVADLPLLDPGLLPVLQLCDAPAEAPRGPSPDGLHPLQHEARFKRLLPGAGELPLDEFAAAMPPTAILTVEAPSPAVGLDATVRFMQVLAATRSSLVGAEA
jgi:sugar phosphate isomerase/epimerase